MAETEATEFTVPRRLALVALVAAAAGLRAFAWSRAAVIFDDGPVFIYIAEAIADGDWSAVVRHPYHPLYSLFIWLAQLPLGDFERAGAAVSIGAGALCVALLFGFLRDAFDERLAWLGAGLLALHPTSVAFSSDVQSDALYSAFFLGSAWLAWRALRDVSVGRALAAGIVAGFAYLVRPEGLGVALAGVAGGAWLGLVGDWGRRRAALWCAAFLLGAGLVALPYIGAIRAETGAWTLTQKKSLGHLATLGAQLEDPGATALPVPRPLPAGSRVIPNNGPLPVGPAASSPQIDGAFERLRRAFGELYLAAAPSLRFELMAVLAIGLWAVRGRPGHRGLFIAAVLVLYGAVLVALAASSGYVSRRHALPPILLLFGYAARGLPAIGGLLLGALARLLPRRAIPGVPAVGAVAAAAVGFVFVAGFFVPANLAPRRLDRLAERSAAEWVRQTVDAPRIVAARRIREAYYADAAFVPIPSAGYPAPELLRYLRRRGARYLVIADDRVDRHAGLRDAQALGMERVYRVEAGGRTAEVYSIRSGTNAAGS